ncbi:hypothetical protein HJC23_001317 [Cyclotella cryptica]|uniref:Uncharacterized protein n=1 Tax=Cyclotella cryptica TaxID=29204 RepID=A0ABD3NXD1_9STRA|eukprot:CCRYP_019263-RA/>CCRYP_019263-RA protein AED:0.09 eAED:0.09 QI:0/-1/0/1/-1/1/1/0/1050
MGDRKKHDRPRRSESPRRSSSPRQRRHSSPARDHRKRPPASQQPPSKRKRRSLPELPFAIGRGRRTNRAETQRARSFSLKRPSRSSSRSTSRSTSRSRKRRTKSQSRSPSADNRHRKAPRKRPHRSIGFAVPSSTPVASSRLDAQFYLALSSLVAVASLAAGTPPSLRDNAEAFSLTLCSVSFALSLMTGGGLRYQPSREGLTRPLFAGSSLERTLHVVSAEMVLNSLQLLLWCTITGLTFSRSTNIAIATPSSVWNTDLYYSTIASLGLSSFLVADGVTAGSPGVYFANGYNFKVAGNERNWVLVIISQIALISFCLEGVTSCDQGETEAFCSGLTWGVCIGMICVLLAMAHFGIKVFQKIISRSRRSRRRTRTSFDTEKISMVATVVAFITLSLSAVNTAFLSKNHTSENSSINVYFASWVSFFASLNLFLGYFDSSLSPGIATNDANYKSDVKVANIRRDEIKALPPSSNALFKRQSTTSTKSSKSSLGFDARVKNAATATACLESIVASNEASGPLLYLDNNLNASGLSVDEENCWPHMQDQPRTIPPTRIRRDDPSRYIPQNGVDPAELTPSDQRQKSVRVQPVPRSRDSSRQCGTDPLESVSTTTSDFNRNTRTRGSVASSTIEPRIEKQPIIPPPPGPTKPTTLPPPKSQAGPRTPPLQEPVRLPRIPSSKDPSIHSGVESMTGFVTSQPAIHAHSKSHARKPENKSVMKASMLSLFDEDFPGNAVEEANAAVAQVNRLPTNFEPNSSTEESSPNTLDPPPTLDPSHSSKIRASPSISKASHSIRDTMSKGSKSMSKGSRSISISQSYRSKASSAPSAAKSRTSSRAMSSTTDGSNGPPTLSDDDSGSHISEPLTLSDGENNDQVYEVDVQSQSYNERPFRDISADNLSIVSDPTMDGLDQSQKGAASFLRKESTSTSEGDDHASNCDSVDHMVLMALKQAYELRQQSLRQISSDEKQNKKSSQSSSVKGIPRRATCAEPGVYPPQHHSYRPHSSSERAVTKTSSGSGHASGELGRSIRSFYSHDDFEIDAESKGEDSSAFAC